MKVGDYIHWRYSNYKTYGLRMNEKSGGNRGNTPEAALNEQRKKMRELLPDRSDAKVSIKEDLEKQINFFYDLQNSTINTNYTAEQKAQLLNIMKQVVQDSIKRVGVDTNRAAINWGNATAIGGGSVQVGDKASEFARIRKTKIGGKKKQSEGLKETTTEGAVYRRIQELTELRNKLDIANKENKPISHYDRQFMDAINELYRKYGQLIDDINKSISQEMATKSVTKFTTGFTQKGGKVIGNKKFNITEHSDFVTELNKALAMTKQVTDTEVEGYLGEYLPVVSQVITDSIEQSSVEDVLDTVTKNGIDYIIDLTRSKVVGNQLSRKTVMSSNVINKASLSGSDEAQIGDVKINTSYTKDKVDIILSLPDNQNIKVSNKNIGSNHSIGALKGTSSLNLIQDYSEFANHYLNITANKGNRPDSAPSDLLSKYHDAFKQTIAMHALVGGVWGQDYSSGEFKRNDMAEIMVVNNGRGKNGRFSVYFMSDIFNNISNNLDLIDIKGLNDIRQYTNDWVGEKEKNDVDMAWGRVANILTQLRTESLIVSVSQKALISK